MASVFGLAVVIGGVLLCAAPAPAEEADEAAPEPRVIPYLERWEARVYRNEKGESLPYRLLRPAGYDAGTAYPLVVFLHGMGERGSDNESQLINGASELFASDAAMAQYPAVVIVPQCPDGEDLSLASWSNWEPDGEPITRPTRLVLEIVEAAREEFRIDGDRLYVGGLSMGGFGTWNIIQEHPDLFAAAFPICGGGDPAKAGRIAALPIWVFQGARDDVVPPERSREMVTALQEAGGHPGYSEYPDVGHDSWTCAFEEPRLMAWLFGQRRGGGDEDS